MGTCTMEGLRERADAVATVYFEFRRFIICAAGACILLLLLFVVRPSPDDFEECDSEWESVSECPFYDYNEHENMIHMMLDFQKTCQNVRRMQDEFVAKEISVETMLTPARARRKRVLEFVQGYPGTAIEAVVITPFMPIHPLIDPEIEFKIKVGGRYHVMCTDTMRGDNIDRCVHMLLAKETKRPYILFSQNYPASGTDVFVYGYEVWSEAGPTIAADIPVINGEEPPRVVPVTSGEMSVVVARVSVNGVASESVIDFEIAAAFWEKESWGASAYTFTAVDVAVNGEYESEDLCWIHTPDSQLHVDVYAQLTASGLSGHPRYVFVLPPNHKCKWSVLTELGTPWMYVNGHASVVRVTQGFGHNYGFRPAHVWRRCRKPIDMQHPGAVLHSGDPYDIMGSLARGDDAVYTFSDFQKYKAEVWVNREYTQIKAYNTDDGVLSRKNLYVRADDKVNRPNFALIKSSGIVSVKLTLVLEYYPQLGRSFAEGPVVRRALDFATAYSGVEIEGQTGGVLALEDYHSPCMDLQGGVGDVEVALRPNRKVTACGSALSFWALPATGEDGVFVVAETGVDLCIDRLLEMKRPRLLFFGLVAACVMGMSSRPVRSYVIPRVVAIATDQRAWECVLAGFLVWWLMYLLVWHSILFVPP